MYRDIFIKWYFNDFKEHILYKDMLETTEGSRHHQELNVAYHTDMVVANYIALTPFEWTKHEFIGALVCAFHDVAKPHSLEYKESEERGRYKVFYGHELLSSRFFENWVYSENKEFLDLLDINSYDIYMIMWLIENHIPYKISKKEKLRNICKTVLNYFQNNTIFINILLADSYGRIKGYTHEQLTEHNNKQDIWFEMFNQECIELQFEEPKTETIKTMTMLIGPSGSGKSSWLKKSVKNTANIHSMDIIRHELYDKDDYSNAFKKSLEDVDFEKKVKADFIQKLKNPNSQFLFVDNTNLSKKRRRFYITEAKKHNVRVVALVFQNSLNALLERQQTRDDKYVNNDVVISQYKRLEQPSYGEFDIILVNG